MSISIVLVTFLLQLSVGMSLTVACLPAGLVDRQFFRSVWFWSWLFVLAAMVLKQYSSFQLPEAFGGSGNPVRVLNLAAETEYTIFGVLSFYLWARVRLLGKEVGRLNLAVMALVGALALVLDSLVFRPGLPPLWAQSLLLPLHFLSASLMLGGFLAGMIFGHHYLVNTDMPKRLLLTMAWILIAVVGFRILAVGATLLLHQWVIHPEAQFLTNLTSFQGHGIFFWERVLIGLAMPAVVVFLIYGTARIESNQSATGIMYVAIAFVFIGELAARYLFLLSGIPL